MVHALRVLITLSLLSRVAGGIIHVHVSSCAGLGIKDAVDVRLSSIMSWTAAVSAVSKAFFHWGPADKIAALKIYEDDGVRLQSVEEIDPLTPLRACHVDPLARAVVSSHRIHVVENFLPPQILGAMLDVYRNTSLGHLWRHGFNSSGAPYSGFLRHALTWRLILQVPLLHTAITYIEDYANRHLFLDSPLPKPHKWLGRVHFEIGSLRRYWRNSSHAQGVGIHADTDFPGRCLSAALQLSDLDSNEDGGQFQLLSCQRVAGCDDAPFGESLLGLYKRRFDRQPDNFHVVSEVGMMKNRIVFFLAHNWHRVLPFTSRWRDVLFVWFNCKEECGAKYRYGLQLAQDANPNSLFGKQDQTCGNKFGKRGPL